MLHVKHLISTESYQFMWSCDCISSLLLEASIYSQNKLEFWKRRNDRSLSPSTGKTFIRIRFWFRLLDKVSLLTFTVSGHCSVRNFLTAPSVWAPAAGQLLPNTAPTVCLLTLGGWHSRTWILPYKNGQRAPFEHLVAAAIQVTMGFLSFQQNSCSYKSPKALIFMKWRVEISRLPILLHKNKLSLWAHFNYGLFFRHHQSQWNGREDQTEIELAFSQIVLMFPASLFVMEAVQLMTKLRGQESVRFHCLFRCQLYKVNDN